MRKTLTMVFSLTCALAQAADNEAVEKAFSGHPTEAMMQHCPAHVGVCSSMIANIEFMAANCHDDGMLELSKHLNIAMAVNGLGVVVENARASLAKVKDEGVNIEDLCRAIDRQVVIDGFTLMRP